MATTRRCIGRVKTGPRKGQRCRNRVSGRAKRCAFHSGKAKTSRCWPGYEPVPGKKAYSKGSCRKITRRRNPSGIPERYRRMGFTRVGQKKKSTRSGKKWMVLAKKGDRYKVVHGGYTGMKDFSQHKDPERRKRFWQRMGGKNSAKARDPFSPLYWHKKFKTW